MPYSVTGAAMRVVLDTSVLVSAVRSRRGASFALLAELPQRRFQFGVSVPLLLEYREKLHSTAAAGHTPLTRTQLDAVLAALGHFGQPVPIYFRLRPNLRDESDIMVFECAANFGASHIVTHNVRDFTHVELNAYDIVPIVPGNFLQMIRSSS